MSAETSLPPAQLALRAFLRDLPALWKERPGQWVAYQGERVIGYGKERHVLMRQCDEVGVMREDRVLFCIEPQETEVTLGPEIMD